MAWQLRSTEYTLVASVSPSEFVPGKPMVEEHHFSPQSFIRQGVHRSTKPTQARGGKACRASGRMQDVLCHCVSPKGQRDAERGEMTGPVCRRQQGSQWPRLAVSEHGRVL